VRPGAFFRPQAPEDTGCLAGGRLRRPGRRPGPAKGARPLWNPHRRLRREACRPKRRGLVRRARNVL